MSVYKIKFKNIREEMTLKNDYKKVKQIKANLASIGVDIDTDYGDDNLNYYFSYAILTAITEIKLPAIKPDLTDEEDADMDNFICSLDDEE